MNTTLFYEGQLMGEVISASSINHLWICRMCGRVFAKRFSNANALGWTIWETSCAQHSSKYHPNLFADFYRGGDEWRVKSLATPAAQFLYELEIYERAITNSSEPVGDLSDYERWCRIIAATPSSGFQGPEHSWPQSSINGR